MRFLNVIKKKRFHIRILYEFEKKRIEYSHGTVATYLEKINVYMCFVL